MKSAKTIYLVDDDEDDRMLIREAIENVVEEVAIIEVTDGKKLLELIVDHTSQDQYGQILILMDMNMPRMSGLESLAFIRSDPNTQHIPVVMISTTSNKELIAKAYEQGINAFITKPVTIKDYDDLAEAVNVCFLNNDPSPELPTFVSSFDKRSVLIVEDDPDHWVLMNASLQRSAPDTKIFRVPNLETALNFLTTEWVVSAKLPDLVLLDLYIPTRLSGLNAINEIRNFYITHQQAIAPIVMISASNELEDIDACYRNNASAYMVKSVDLHRTFSFFHSLFYFWWHTITLPVKI